MLSTLPAAPTLGTMSIPDRSRPLKLVEVPPGPAAIAALFGNPSLFFAAVDLAGVYGILVLFGVVPALMAYGSRYGAAALDADDAAPEAVPGGRTSLGAIAGFAAAIIGLETYGRLGVG